MFSSELSWDLGEKTHCFSFDRSLRWCYDEIPIFLSLAILNQAVCTGKKNAVYYHQISKMEKQLSKQGV